MDSSKPSSSSSSHSPSPASVSSQRRTRDSGLCQTIEIPRIESHCIDNLNSHQLGKGTYGVVEKTRYRKSRKHDYRPAAIKYAIGSPSHLNDLIREAKVMWAFRDHSNIIKIYGLYQCPRHGRGVVMEYMDCGSMADLVYERKSIDYTIDHAASWLFQLASAVHIFHVNDQVHRDLKLQNMLLCDRYRTMKLCDFGTFTAMHQSMTSNRGTPITMAPEVFRCEEYNTKSDIYSIGIIMWQLIARNHPYNRNLSVPGLLYNVATANLRPPELECNPILSGFYKRCWHDNADIRPTSAECIKYFGLLKDVFPNGNVPLSDATTNGEAHTPPPRVHRPTPLGTASGSGAGGHGRTPTPSNHLNPTNPTGSGHRRNRSETIGIQPSNLPYPEQPDLVPGRPLVPRSHSEAKSLTDSVQRRPTREAPPPPPGSTRRDSNDDEERKAAFMEICQNEETRPIEPNDGDEKSLEIYHQHCSVNQNLGDIRVLKKGLLVHKHKLLNEWEQHERHSELVDRMHYLEQEISKIERNSLSMDEDSSSVVRM